MSDQDSRKQIPTFMSLEEEAAFWDTHSVAGYWEQMKPVRVKFSLEKAADYSKVLSVRLDEKTYNRISEEARKKGSGGY